MLQGGDRLRVLTPGGGGYYAPDSEWEYASAGDGGGGRADPQQSAAGAGAVPPKPQVIWLSPGFV